MQQTFISLKYRPGAKLALLTFCLAFVVILLGAYTRLTNAGLSCPDWPVCYGFITAPHTMEQIQAALLRFPAMPVDTTKAWTEMTHRYLAGAEGLLLIALALSLILKHKTKPARFAGVWLILLLCIQVSLGMLTVTAKLKPVIVLSHLVTGLTILATLWWVYLAIYFKGILKAPAPTRNLTPFLWAGLFILIAQITLGGWVSTHYAALACIDFPFCNGQILPSMHLASFNSDLITIHMLHRIGALITGTYLLCLSLLLIKQTAYRMLGVILLCLISSQITLGILNIVLLLPVKIAIIHHAVAILLLLTLITTLQKSRILKGVSA